MFLKDFCTLFHEEIASILTFLCFLFMPVDLNIKSMSSE